MRTILVTVTDEHGIVLDGIEMQIDDHETKLEVVPLETGNTVGGEELHIGS